MSWPRSMAPERLWKPMSYVPPSPPKAINLMSSSILPCFLSERYMVSTPEIVAAEFSKALWIQGIFHAVYSDMQDETSRQPVAFDAITGYCDAANTILTTIGAPQPA